MYRLKYYSLKKEEKDKLKDRFYQTDYGKTIKIRLTRVLIIGILCLVFGSFLIVTNEQIWDIISGVSLLIASVIFIIGSFKVRINKLNDYLIKEKRK